MAHTDHSRAMRVSKSSRTVVVAAAAVAATVKNSIQLLQLSLQSKSMLLRLESRDCLDSMNVVWLPVQLSRLAIGQSSPTALQFHTAHAKEIITINKM